MHTSPFHIYYKARILEEFTEKNRLIPAYASSNVEIYPYQIAAAKFALRSVYLPGIVCADECSLGKTYVALLIATQKWFEGKERLLLVLPVNLIGQWVNKIQNSFSIPYVLIDKHDKFNSVLSEENANPFLQDGLIITTYELAAQKAEQIKLLHWDLIIFDEADRLNKSYSEESKMARTLKEATDGSFKMLLTGTPITMDIRDIYGLIYFIDEKILPTDIDTFYKHYFRRPDRYPELAEWVSRYCFRTLKNQVDGYVNFTERIPYTIDCKFTKEEKLLYDKLQEYIAMPEKLAYPDMKIRDIGLQHNHVLSSSAKAYSETVDGAIATLKQLPDNKKNLSLYKYELEILDESKMLAKACVINGKTKMLLSVLKKCFAYFKKIKFPQKAVIYVDILTSIQLLQTLLNKQGYYALTFSGSNSRDFSVIERFRNDDTVKILIATGNVTKGLDLEFCPLVINYDLLSNALEIEQRISRCHRQKQSSDVLVINLFSKQNDADLRYLELINKRTLQFKGIFGLSDMALGNFDDEISMDEVLSKLRSPDLIQKSFAQNLIDNETQNREILADSTDTLFTTFTKEIADKIKITPQYISEKVTEIENDLWEITKYFFKCYNEYEPDPDDFITQFTNAQKHSCYFEINEQEKTITAHPYDKGLPILFYYWSGSQNKPYKSLKKYGMDKNFKPHHGKITLASPIGRGIIASVQCADSGTIIVDGNALPCTIGLYCVQILLKEKSNIHKTVVEEKYLLTGKTEYGRVLNNEDCKKILELPVKAVTDNGQKSSAWSKGTNARSHELDGLVSKEEILQSCMKSATPAIQEEIERLRYVTARQKSKLEYAPDDLKAEIYNLNKELEDISDRIKHAKIKRQISLLQKRQRQEQENLHSARALLDEELKRQIEELTAGQNWSVNIMRHFVVQINTENDGGSIENG